MARSMRGYLARKLVYLLITVILIMTFNFLLFRIMPGDPVNLMMPHADKITKDLWRHILGYDQPLWIQYINYMVATFQGDLGTSVLYIPHAHISDILPNYIWKTVFMCGAGTIIAVVAGIIYGREAAWRKGKMFDKVATTAGVILYSIPTFIFAIFFIMVFATLMPGWPLAGATSESDIWNNENIVQQFLDAGQHAFLPMLAVVLESLAGFALIVRSSLIDVFTEDYILTAEAKGLEPREILKKHAMPNALLPVVAIVALNVGWIIGGTIMIEYIFTYKGIGYLGWEAILHLDYPILQAVFFIEIICVLVANFIADILNFYLDPRVKI